MRPAAGRSEPPISQISTNRPGDLIPPPPSQNQTVAMPVDRILLSSRSHPASGIAHRPGKSLSRPERKCQKILDKIVPDRSRPGNPA